ncbi:MAG: CD225/dispanin family protein [Planctomycetaceae bacterium]|nr:CD225/dispanin family protein [Planctomycetaceae bacterium]
MANHYYYDNNGQKQGPITDEELRNLTASGVIVPQTRLEHDSGKQGFASQVPGLCFAPQSLPPNNSPQPQYHSPPNTSSPQQAPNTTGYLIWSIITTLCCCIPLGIVGIIFSVQASTSVKNGRFDEATAQCKTAFWCNLIGMIVGFISCIIGIVVQLAIENSN